MTAFDPQTAGSYLAAAVLIVLFAVREVRRKLSGTSTAPAAAVPVGTDLSMATGVRELVAHVTRLESEAVILKARVTELETRLTQREQQAITMERRVDQLLEAIAERDRMIARLRSTGTSATDDAGDDD